VRRLEPERCRRFERRPPEASVMEADRSSISNMPPAAVVNTARMGDARPGVTSVMTMRSGDRSGAGLTVTTRRGEARESASREPLPSPR
jgi:hypothetical protein